MAVYGLTMQEYHDKLGVVGSTVRSLARSDYTVDGFKYGFWEERCLGTHWHVRRP